ncbi:hypothetical protein NDO11_19520, partial [Mycobacterium tuberculosis]|nr:hypothetical protein [Mycobacterium tuberculosis]
MTVVDHVVQPGRLGQQPGQPLRADQRTTGAAGTGAARGRAGPPVAAVAAVTEPEGGSTGPAVPAAVPAGPAVTAVADQPGLAAGPASAAEVGSAGACLLYTS